MQTQTHLLAAAAAFARPDKPLRNTAVVIGAIVPDLSIYVLWGSSKLAGTPERVIWRDLYWQEPWQLLGAVFNSAILYGVLALIGWLLLQNIVAKPKQSLSAAFNPDRMDAVRASGVCLLFVGLAALLHVALDFPVHSDDAHRHFWPVTDWRFYSPISYYRDAVGFGADILIGLLSIGILAWCFRAWWVRVLLGLALIPYVAVPAYFILTLVAGD